MEETTEINEQQEESPKSDIGIKSETTNLKGQFSGGIQNFFAPMGEKEVISCPNCRTVPDENDYGAIKCRKCGTVFFVSSSFLANIASFPNLTGEKNETYKNQIAHVSNFIILGNFKLADDFCNQAIDLSPATPQAWEYKAYCAYFLIRDKKFILDTNAEAIIRFLSVAKSHYKDEKELEMVGSFKNITERIADRVFNMIKHRIFWARIHEDEIEDNEISELIYAFRTCYRIHPYKSIYLETMLEMYLGYDIEAWATLEIDKNEEKGYRFVDNSHLGGNLFDLIEIVAKQIREDNKNYIMKPFKVGEKNMTPMSIEEFYQIKLEEYNKRGQRELTEAEKKGRLKKAFEIGEQENKAQSTF
ncbi:MAG: hypothetical protein IPN20_23240 [Haliscomenobacter sp.]|nr:hypothetical protein [Haliscomenobacter sp.]